MGITFVGLVNTAQSSAVDVWGPSSYVMIVCLGKIGSNHLLGKLRERQISGEYAIAAQWLLKLPHFPARSRFSLASQPRVLGDRGHVVAADRCQ